MILKAKKPKTIDIQYVENVFSLFTNAIGEIKQSSSHLELFPTMSNYNELRAFLYKMLFEVGVKARIVFTEVNLEYVFGLPRTYYYDDDEEGILLSITPFGVDNAEITICEVLLFLMGVKLAQFDIGVDQEIYEDVENSYRPLLVLLAIFLGYGRFLILRNWVSGSFYDQKKELSIKYKYHIPLDLDTMIYAYTLISYLQNELYKKEYQEYGFFDKGIIKEIKNCYQFLTNGSSEYAEWVKTECLGACRLG